MSEIIKGDAMAHDKFIIVVIFICCCVFTASACLAETYYQKDKLFSINVPEGWSVSEKPGSVKIVNPKRDNGISIQFKATDISQKDVAEQSHINTLMMGKAIAEKLKGTIAGEKETSVDGVYARQLDYITNLSGITANSTYIVIINAAKGYAFTITFGASAKGEKEKMENAVKSFRFQ